MAFCEVLAEVVIEGASHPAAPWYLCTASVANPAVCTSSISYNVLLQDHAFKELNKLAADKGCQLAIQAGRSVTRIALVKGAESIQHLDSALERGKQTYNAINTPSGMQWLMHYLAR